MARKQQQKQQQQQEEEATRKASDSDLSSIPEQTGGHTGRHAQNDYRSRKGSTPSVGSTPTPTPTPTTGAIRTGRGTRTAQVTVDGRTDGETEVDVLTRTSVCVTRSQSVQLARMELPVCKMEQEVVEAIGQHDVLILCGETGSGKSTQV